MLQLAQRGAGQDQQVLRDGQVVHIHDPQGGVVVAQVQHGGHIARVAVLKGDHAMGCIAAFHRVEDLVPGGVADRLRMGEERLERDVRKGSLHALIGGAVPAQHLGLVLLGYIHHVLYVVAVIGAQGGVLNARFGLVQHHGFPRGIEDRQAVGLFVFGDRQHSRHPPLEQRAASTPLPLPSALA